MLTMSGMKELIVKAHNDCNKGAINKAMCKDLGVAEQVLEQWISYVDRLHGATKEFLEMSHDPNATDRQLTAAEGKVFAAWKDVLKNGTADEFQRGFFIRKKDVVHIAGLCGEKFISTAIGTRLANHTSTDFRRNIERLVGVRMVVGGYLKDDDATLILDYEGALKTIKSCTAQIEGEKRGKVEVEGLNATIAKLEAKLQSMIDFAAQYKIEGEARDALLSGIKSALSEARETLTAAQDKLKEATTKRDNLEVKYNEVMARLHRIDETY